MPAQTSLESNSYDTEGGSSMKSMKRKLITALAAALVIGTLLLAGTAPYGPPGVRSKSTMVDGQ
jgi:hypothetical protein